MHSILNTDGQVLIDLEMADLYIRIEREDQNNYWLLARDISGIKSGEPKEKSVKLTSKQVGQVLCLICDGDDTDPNLYVGLEEVFGEWSLNLRPIP